MAKHSPNKNFHESKSSQLEIDLDITGEYSLHRLIDTAKSKGGSELLKKILCTIPERHDKIISRQNLVKELISLSHFRDKFLLTSALTSKNEIDADLLNNWLLKNQTNENLFGKFVLLFVFALINVSLILLSIFDIVPKVFWFTSFGYMALNYLFHKSVKNYSSEAEFLKDELKKIIGILSFIENYNFGANKVANQLRSNLTKNNVRPSKQLKEVNSVLTVLTFRKNPALWFFIVMICPVDFFLAYKTNILKERLKNNLNLWLDVLYKFECFVSLANFGYLNPDYNFPGINKSVDPNFEIQAVGIGHPLIPSEKNVKNNLEISETGKIYLITGSNMSGKSTFLRTIGLNICLAYSGAPVSAEKLILSVMRLFTCIKVSDSVIDGISYFYAEVKRLKKLLDEIESNNKIPILFLVDEIFKGTNNIERNIGGKALLNTLSNKNGSGIISTHDLDLVKLTDENKSISNYHFREKVEGNEMVFDYKLHNGPCPTTNALKIMKAAGLPID